MNNQQTPRIIIKHGNRSYWQRPTISPSNPCRDCCFRGITKECECPQGFPPCAPAKGRGATAMTFEDVTDSPLFSPQDAQAASGDVAGMDARDGL
jgi:hypothetical protein